MYIYIYSLHFESLELLWFDNFFIQQECIQLIGIKGKTLEC